MEEQGALRVVREPADLELTGPVKAVMHIEGAEAIEAGLGNLPALHARGLRSLGISWSDHRAASLTPGRSSAAPMNSTPAASSTLCKSSNVLAWAVSHSPGVRSRRWMVAGLTREARDRSRADQSSSARCGTVSRFPAIAPISSEGC